MHGERKKKIKLVLTMASYACNRHTGWHVQATRTDIEIKIYCNRFRYIVTDSDILSFILFSIRKVNKEYFSIKVFFILSLKTSSLSKKFSWSLWKCIESVFNQSRHRTIALRLKVIRTGYCGLEHHNGPQGF